MHLDKELSKNLKLNYIANVADGGFFGLALGFASFSTIIPLFVSSLTNSAILIGLVVALHSLGWQLPQLLIARRVSRLVRYKPLVMILTIHERIPFLGLVFIALMLPKIGPSAALVLVFLMLAWQGIGGGMTANPWQNMINKVIPPDYLATFFGIQGAASNLLASGGAIVAGIILSSTPYPYNYSYVFLIACMFMIVSYVMIGLTREPVHSIAPPIENQPNLFRTTLAILKKDRNFSWLLVGRMLSQFGVMGSSFYAVHVVKNLGANEIQAGALASVLMIASFVMNIVLGRLADRWRKIAVLEIGAVSIVLANLIAWYGPSISWFYLANILISVANTCLWTIMMAVALQFGSDEERPMYVGMANTLITPATALAPFVGGLLANAFGYQAAFLASAISGALSVLVYQFLVHEPHPRFQKGKDFQPEKNIPD
jgi:MFS family permease